MSIRSETDPEMIKNFGVYEKQIIKEWESFKLKQLTPEENKKKMQGVLEFLKSAFGEE